MNLFSESTVPVAVHGYGCRTVRVYLETRRPPNAERRLKQSAIKPVVGPFHDRFCYVNILSRINMQIGISIINSLWGAPPQRPTFFSL